jgi:hypothetical protein
MSLCNEDILVNFIKFILELEPNCNGLLKNLYILVRVGRLN